MSAYYLDIESKHRQGLGALASLDDFTCTDGDPVSADIIMSNPATSLYCLDDDTKRAIFVEIPPDINLASAPFYYLAQHEHAQRLIAVPYGDFLRIADTLPPVENLIIMYMTGRSGSTLLSHIFNELDDVVCLSEPDVVTQFVHLRHDAPERENEFKALFDATIRVLFKPNPFKAPTACAFKGRSHLSSAMDLFQATFPHAKNLFMFRDVVGFVRSFDRLFRSSGFPDEQPLEVAISGFSEWFGHDLKSLIERLELDIDPISRIQWLTVWWICLIEDYLAQTSKGIPAMPINYTNFNTNRESTVTAIFDYCDLSTDKVPDIMHMFDRDSQAGSVLARENPKQGNQLQLTQTQTDEIRNIIERHPVIKSVDYFVLNS